MSSASTSVHHVASRSAADRRCVAEPDLGQLEAPVAELAPDGVVQEPRRPHRTRIRPWPRRRRRPLRRRGTGASARPVRGGRGPARGVARRRGSTPAGRPSTKRAAFQSLLREVAGVLQLLAAEPLVGPRRVPWISAKRSASAPNSSMVSSGSTTLPLVLRHLLAVRVPDEAVRGRPCGTARSPMRWMPSIIIRATQKKMMS